MKPMLSATVDQTNIKKLKFPLLASPKYDGIRTLIHPLKGPVTRSLDPIRNEHLKRLLNRPEYHGLDGELIAGPPTAKNVFQRTTSAVMAFKGDSFDAVFYVFDDFTRPEAHFVDRLRSASATVEDHNVENRVDLLLGGGNLLAMVPHTLIHNMEQLEQLEQQFVTEGYEGIMLRNPLGPYKYGRSTFNQQWLMKLKRMTDDEAIIVGFKPLKVNNNEAVINNLGYQERSNVSSGLVEVEELGAFIVKCSKFDDTFDVGTGFTAQQRVDYWKNRRDLEGKTISFRYQQSGVKDLPRFPSFKGFRED